MPQNSRAGGKEGEGLSDYSHICTPTEWECQGTIWWLTSRRQIRTDKLFLSFVATVHGRRGLILLCGCCWLTPLCEKRNAGPISLKTNCGIIKIDGQSCRRKRQIEKERSYGLKRVVVINDRERDSWGAMLEVFLQFCRRFPRSLSAPSSKFRKFSSGRWGPFAQIRSQLRSGKSCSLIHNNENEVSSADSATLTLSRKVGWGNTWYTYFESLNFENITARELNFFRKLLPECWIQGIY